MATIQSMEQGKLCVLREGPNGAYYNLQHREHGANVTRYIPAEQVPLVQANLAAYAQFQELLERYVQVLSTRSREERLAGVKKKLRSRPTSTSRRKPKSKPS
jgi:hypothetical protein